MSTSDERPPALRPTSRLRFSSLDHLEILSAPRYRAYLEAFRPMRFTRGALIHPRLEGRPGFLVRSGRVRIFMSEGGEEFTLGYLERGGFLTATLDVILEADEECEVLVIADDDLRLHSERHPELVMLGLQNTLELLNATLGVVRTLAFHDVRCRVAAFVVHAADTCGEPRGDAVYLPLRLSTGEIARLLGTRRQRVSTALNEFVHAGLLERTPDAGLLVKRLDALRVEAERAGSADDA